MSALIFPTDVRVGYKNGTEPTWHGYDVELPEGVMPGEAVRFVGADYPVNVLKASMAKTAENSTNHEDLSLAGPSTFLVTTPMPETTTDPEAPQAPDNYDPREMPSFSGDTLVLGVCSQDYRVISNMEIAEVADRFVVAADEYLREHEENPDPSIKLALPAVDSVGTLRGRRVFFLSLLLGGFGLAFKAPPVVASEESGEDKLPLYELDLPGLTRYDGETLSGAILTFDAESYTIRQGDDIIDSGHIDIDEGEVPAVTLLPRRESGDNKSPDPLHDESYSYLDKIVADALRKKEETAPESADLNEEGDGGSGLDSIEARLLFVSSHDGSRPLSVKIVFTRVVCNNTLSQAELDPKVAKLFVIKHLGDTKAKLGSMAGAMEYLVKTTGDFKQRLQDYSNFELADEEADLLAGYFFGFSWKLTWLREIASRLWRGEGLLGAESIQAPSLYRLYNVVTQILSHEQQGGADASEEEQKGASFSSGILDKYKGNRSPTEAAAYMARIYSNRDSVLEEARQAAQVAEKKNKEGVEKMSAAKAGKE